MAYRATHMPLFRSVAHLGGASGTLYLHSMPGRFEPLDDTWREIKAQHVTQIVCLAPLEEIEPKSPMYAHALVGQSVPVLVVHSPIADRGVPADPKGFWRVVTATADVLQHGHSVLLHCAAARGAPGSWRPRYSLLSGIA